MVCRGIIIRSGDKGSVVERELVVDFGLDYPGDVVGREAEVVVFADNLDGMGYDGVDVVVGVIVVDVELEQIVVFVVVEDDVDDLEDGIVVATTGEAVADM